MKNSNAFIARIHYLTVARVNGGFALQRQCIIGRYPAVVAAAGFEQVQPLNAVFFAAALTQRTTQRPLRACTNGRLKKNKV